MGRISVNTTLVRELSTRRGERGSQRRMISANLTAKLVSQAKLLVYNGGAYGLLHVDKDRLNADLQAFLRG